MLADEVGIWMIPADEKQYIVAYIASLAAVVSPESFTATALPLLQRERTSSFTGQVIRWSGVCCCCPRGGLFAAAFSREGKRFRVQIIAGAWMRTSQRIIRLYPK